MICFTSDLHLGHSAIIHMKNRPFADVEEMNRKLISNYNSVVHKKDTVYILGDISHRLKVDAANELIHCCSSSTQELLGGGLFTLDVLTNYLEQIRQAVTFKKWFFGHYHDNKNVNAEEILLYEQIIRIS